MTIGDIAVADPEARVIYVGTGENNSSRTRTPAPACSRPPTAAGRGPTSGSTTRTTSAASSSTAPTRRSCTWPRSGTSTPRTRSAASTSRATAGARGSACSSSTSARAPSTSSSTRRARRCCTRRPGSARARPRTSWRAGRAAAIWRSTDSGRTWSRLAGGLPAGATVGRIGLDVSPARPETVYAVIDNQSLRPETEPLDEDTPPGELTARRLRALSADGFGAPRRRHHHPVPARQRVPQGADGARAEARRQGGQDHHRRPHRLPAGREPRPVRARDRGLGDVPQRRRRRHLEEDARGAPGEDLLLVRLLLRPRARRSHGRRPRVLRRRAHARLRRRRPHLARARRARRARRPSRAVHRSPRAQPPGPGQRRRAEPLLRPRRDLDQGEQRARRPVHDPRPRQRRAVQHPRRPPGQRGHARAVDLQPRARATPPPGSRSTAATGARSSPTRRTPTSSTPPTSSATRRGST